MIETEWTHGTITFSRTYDPRPDYSLSLPKRQQSASQQAHDRQKEPWQQWDHLMKLGLHSLVEYFREDRNGTAIPKTFQAQADVNERYLNNFS